MHNPTVREKDRIGPVKISVFRVIRHTCTDLLIILQISSLLYCIRLADKYREDEVQNNQEICRYVPNYFVCTLYLFPIQPSNTLSLLLFIFFQVLSPFFCNCMHRNIRAYCFNWGSGAIKPRIILLVQTFLKLTL